MRYSCALILALCLTVGSHGFRKHKRRVPLDSDARRSPQDVHDVALDPSMTQVEGSMTSPLLCALREPVFISSHGGQQLEDRRGVARLKGDRGSYQKWTISDAGGGNVFITSHRDVQLEDRSGRVGLNSDKGSLQKWLITNAGQGKVFITSLSGNQLQDSEGSVGLAKNKADEQKWKVSRMNGQDACTQRSPSPSPSPTPSPSPPISPSPSRPITEIQRSSDTKLRVGSYNVFRSRVFRGSREEAFKRIANSLQADVWVMQEVSYGDTCAPKAEGDQWLNQMRKYTGNSKWQYSWNCKGLYLLSLHPIVWQKSFHHRVHATWIRLPQSVSSSDLVVVNVHLAPGNTQRQRDQAAMGVDFLNQVRAGKYKAGSEYIPADATIMFAGDFNSGMEADRYKMVTSLDSGYKRSGYKPTPRTEMIDAAPMHLTSNERATLGSVNFNNGAWQMSKPGKAIDFVFFKSSDLVKESSFILNTLILDDRTLAANGLGKMDVAMEPTKKLDTRNSKNPVDHLPLIVDLKKR